MTKTTLTIILSKIEHKGQQRIKVEFKRNPTLIAKIKSIPDRKWSASKRCWHVPYSKDSLKKVEHTFGKENLILPKKVKPLKENDKPNQKIVTQEDQQIIEFTTYQYKGIVKKKFVGEKIIIQQKNKEWLNVFIPYDKKGWMECVKNINGRIWNVEKTCWEIPNVKQSYWQLKEHIGMKNIQLGFEIKKDIPEKYDAPIFNSYFEKKKTIRVNQFELLNEDQKKAIQLTEEQIILKRLSHHTLKSYKNHLIAIFLFLPEINPKKITVKDIEKYLLHEIKFKKISESTQNQIINSIKAYWEKVLDRPKTRVDIPRPKKPKHLPNVFSQEEVIRLIECPKNLKHKLILLLIYSAGLRLGEVINIRTRDINVDRRVIFIKNGKGKKDRFVTLAEEVISYLKSYKSQYRPIYWLFEGQSGGKYSKRSVQNIFHKALEKSKVFAYGTVHTLRHSYATHCIENGFDVALLQEALGHGSIKTTEKYLHISSKVLKKLKSPLDIYKNKS